MNEFFDNLGKVVNETARKAFKASGDVVELTKTSLNIKFDEVKRESFFKEIGKIIYNNYKISPDSVSEDVLDFCKCVEEIENTINSQKAKAANIKNRKYCVNCGVILAKTVNYCYSCGTKQPEIIEEEPEECCDCCCDDVDDVCECGCCCEDADCDCEADEDCCCEETCCCNEAECEAEEECCEESECVCECGCEDGEKKDEE